MKLYVGLIWQYEYGSDVTKRFLLFIMNKKITKKKKNENCCYGWNKHLSNPFNLNSLSQKKICVCHHGKGY